MTAPGSSNLLTYALTSVIQRVSVAEVAFFERPNHPIMIDVVEKAFVISVSSM
jgi:hypothetical protein